MMFMRSKIVKLVISFAIVFGLIGQVSAQENEALVAERDSLHLEQLVKAGIQKAYAASVRIWGYDTVKNIQNSSQFSGVVVSKEGHILTVAHAIQPGRSYKVRFPDGREVIALSLGRVGFANEDNRPDLAMIKIKEEGSWPVAEMGWSYSLKENEPCIGISYPATLNRMLPSVRFGRIVRLQNRWGFVHSTCKMEPGDSGGPLFDYMGRVIAMHSRCGRDENENYEVPIDLYRKYWRALNISEDYKALPQQTDEIGEDPHSGSKISLMSLEKPAFSLPELEERLSASTVSVTSTINGLQIKSLGTLVKVKSNHLIISKSSIVGTDVQIVTGGKNIPAKAIGRDTESDLVILQAEGRIRGGLTKDDFANSPDSLNLQNLGTLLISPLPAGSLPSSGSLSSSGTLSPSGRKVGIISSSYMDLPKVFSAGYFGASAQFREGKIILNRIAPKSPVDSVRLKIGDQVTGINGIPISRPEEYGGELRKYDPGDSITVECIRADSVFTKKLLLTKRPRGAHAAEQFDGGKSIRCDGFNRVFAHDANIKAEECGGPVFDTKGNFLGINIARFSRTTTLVIPAASLAKILEGIVKY